MKEMRKEGLLPTLMDSESQNVTEFRENLNASRINEMVRDFYLNSNTWVKDPSRCLTIMTGRGGMEAIQQAMLSQIQEITEEASVVSDMIAPLFVEPKQLF